MFDPYAALWARFADPEAGARSADANGLLEVSGPDAVDFVQRLSSQDIAGLADGESAFTAFLNGKGKLLEAAVCGKTGDTLWLATAEDRVAGLAELLDRFLFTEKLTIRARDDLVGSTRIARAGDDSGFVCEVDGGVTLTAHRFGIVFEHHFGEQPAFTELEQLDSETSTAARVLARFVRVGVDTDERTIALEAPLDDHVSTTKGCYTGQEIVARIHTYGHVNRKVVLCTLDRAVDLGAEVVDDEGEVVGRVQTSVALGDGAVGFGYLPAVLCDGDDELRVGEVEVRVVV